jgi:Zn-dependent protease with chaperone function
MPWFWFILMLMALLVGNSVGSSSSLAAFLQGLQKNEPNFLVLIGPSMVALLLAKAWMVYIGRYVESGELSQEAASNMWEHGLRWATILGASGLVLLEPLAGVTDQVVNAKEYSETWATLLALMPLLLFALMMDSLAYQWEQYCFQSAEDSASSSLEKPLLFLWRKAQFGWLMPLAPMLISCMGVDLLKLIFSEEMLQQWAILFVPVLSLLVAMAVGGMVLSVWTESMMQTHPHGKQWQKLFQEIGEPVRDIRIWRTGNRINNAMLLGFVSRFRYVILTDKLLSTLTTRELEMVLLHEAAHSKCQHGLKRFLMLAGGLATLGTAFQLWCWGIGNLDSWNPAETMSLGVWRIAYWGGVVGLFLLSLLLARCVKWIWHRTELEADRVACQLSVQFRQGEYSAGESTEVLHWNKRRQHWKSAMELSTALYNLVGNEQRAARDTWTHPSVKSRVRELANFFALGGR